MLGAVAGVVLTRMHFRLKRDFARNVLPNTAQTTTRVQRFLTEALAISRLTIPHRRSRLRDTLTVWIPRHGVRARRIARG